MQKVGVIPCFRHMFIPLRGLQAQEWADFGQDEECETVGNMRGYNLEVSHDVNYMRVEFCKREAQGGWSP